MRCVACLLVAVVCSGAFAGEPVGVLPPQRNYVYFIGTDLEPTIPEGLHARVISLLRTPFSLGPLPSVVSIAASTVWYRHFEFRHAAEVGRTRHTGGAYRAVSAVGTHLKP